MTLFIICGAIGFCLGVIVMGVLAHNAYEEGAAEAIALIAKRRRGL